MIANEDRNKGVQRWWPIIAALLTWAVTVIGAVWAASAERADVLSQLGTQRTILSDHESRLRTMERQTSEIAADVRWMRREMEQKTARP